MLFAISQAQINKIAKNQGNTDIVKILLVIKIVLILLRHHQVKLFAFLFSLICNWNRI